MISLFSSYRGTPLSPDATLEAVQNRIDVLAADVQRLSKEKELLEVQLTQLKSTAAKSDHWRMKILQCLESSDAIRPHAARITNVFIKEEFGDGSLLQQLSVSTCYDMLRNNGITLSFGFSQRIVHLLTELDRTEI
jgi:hypothetical protein